MTWDPSALTISGTPSNDDAESFTILFEFWDPIWVSNKPSHSFNFEVKPNQPPQLIPNVPSMPAISVLNSVSYSDLRTLFTDPEDDDITITVTMSPSVSWPTYDEATGLTSGAPLTNTDADTYTITVRASNTFTTTTLTSQLDLQLLVNPDQPPTLSTILNEQTMVPEPIMYDLSSSCQDPENLQLVLTMSLIDGSALPSFITWTDVNKTIFIEPSNDDVGTY